MVVSKASTVSAVCSSAAMPLASQRGAQGLGLRGPHPHAGRGLVGQVGQRGLGDEPSAGDDDDVVDGLGHFGQEVARHQHGAALVGVGTEELAQPVDALGVEAVGGLVEDEHLGFAQQGGGQTEALAHPEREALDPPVAGVGEADQVEHLVHPAHGKPGGDAQHPEVVAGPPSGVEAGGLEHRPDVTERVRRAGGRAGRRWWRSRLWGSRDRAASAGWWSCPHRWGRGIR